MQYGYITYFEFLYSVVLHPCPHATGTPYCFSHTMPCCCLPSLIEGLKAELQRLAAYITFCLNICCELIQGHCKRTLLFGGLINVDSILKEHLFGISASCFFHANIQLYMAL